MGNLKRNFLAIGLCLASLLSISKGEETAFANARRDFSNSIITRIKEANTNDDDVFDEALNQANTRIDSFDWVKGFNSGVSYYDPSTKEGKDSLNGDHFKNYEDDILDFYDGLDSDEKDDFIRLKDDGDNDVDNMVNLMKYRFDVNAFDLESSPNDVAVDQDAFNVAKGNNKYDMAVPSIGNPVTTTPGYTDPGKGPIFGGGGLGPIHSSSVSGKESTSQTLNDMLLLAGLSVTATAVVVGGVKTIEGTIAAWLIPSFAKAAIIAVAILAIMVVLIVYFQQILDIFSAIAQSLEDLVSNFVSGISQMFEDAKKKGYESLVDGSFYLNKKWTDVINLTKEKAESLSKDKRNYDYFIAYRPNALFPKVPSDPSELSKILRGIANTDTLWIIPFPIPDEVAVERLKNKSPFGYWFDAYTPLRSHAFDVEKRVLSENTLEPDKSLLYINDCPGDSNDKTTKRYHHFHVEKKNYTDEPHFIGSHNFYGLPYRPSTGGIHKGDYHPIIGGK